MTLKELRLSKGLNQKQASAISKVSIYHIRKLEHGNNWGKLGILPALQLMEALNVPFSELNAAVHESARIQTETKAQA